MNEPVLNLLLFVVVFIIMGAYMHDNDLTNQVEKGSIRLWSSDKVYKICEVEYNENNSTNK